MSNLESLFGLESRTAIVTGASSGLGARFAEVLHDVGARVVVAARRIDALDHRFGGRDRYRTVACDVTSAVDRKALVEVTVGEFGGIDVLVNNAGGGNAQVAQDDTLASFAQLIDLNLTSAFALSMLVGRYMTQLGRGSIINVSSIMGIVAATPADESGYVASKAGLIGLTRQLGTYWARKGVRVNSLAPGFFPSEGADAGYDDRAKAFIESNCPIPRRGERNELDAALLLLAGDGSTYMTGQTVVVDGGWTSR